MSNPIKKCMRCGVYQTARFCECESNTLPDLEEWNHIVADFPAPPAEETEATGGTKYDEGKPDLSLLPKSFVEGVAKALMYGQKKYGRDNYKKGFKITRIVSAILRHAFAYLSKEELDKESNLPHLFHMGAGVAMLIEILHLGTAEDDR